MRFVVLFLLAVVLAGCSAVPNMDAGSAGCQNARGIGPPPREGPTDMAVMPHLHGKDPFEAGQLAVARGHTVVFNADGSCWCVPPPGGTVTESWWGQHGALWLWVDGYAGPEKDRQPPFAGWGC